MKYKNVLNALEYYNMTANGSMMIGSAFRKKKHFV